MKKSKLLLGLSLSAMVLAATPALAADPVPADTKGTIDFIKSTDTTGTIEKPETDGDEIETEEGSSTQGLLRLQFVPDFDFGTRELKTGKQTFNPTYVKYNYKDQAAHPNESGDQYMPHFVQVTDETGTDNGFKVKVKSTIFQRKIQVADTLPTATITLNYGRFDNSVYDETEFNGVMNKFDGKETGFVIPTDDNSIQIMNTNAGKSTNGSKTSLILDNTYDAANHAATATTENKDIVFTKTNKDIATIIDYAAGQPKDPYTATITWTVESGL